MTRRAGACISLLALAACTDTTTQQSATTKAPGTRGADTHPGINPHKGPPDSQPPEGVISLDGGSGWVSERFVPA